jgi:hypothetical protein
MVASCKCQAPPFHFADYDIVELGEDLHGAEASLWTCKLCGATWLKYLIEEPHFSQSGRWWRVVVPSEKQTTMTALSAKAFVQQQQEGFAGGSYFRSTGHKVSAPIRVA